MKSSICGSTKLKHENKPQKTLNLNHSHEKQKDSLERWTARLIFLIELEISGVAVQGIHQNSKKWWLFRGVGQ